MNSIKQTVKKAGALLLACGMLLGSMKGPAWAGPGSPVVQPQNTSVSPAQKAAAPAAKELKGVWISYIEWDKVPKEKDQFEAAVNTMLDNCVSWGMNAVFVHAHSHTDAMYPSELLPWSKFASGVSGNSPGYDPFGYVVEAAHQRGLEIHAWFNPYRVTGYLMGWDQVSPESPAKKWLSDGDPANDRWVLRHDGQYYLNPAVPQVKELVVNSVKEVVQKYAVDGIHFDDYFYPAVNDLNNATQFDRPEYLASNSTMNISDWRRENVSDLVRRTYAAVKELKPDVAFGVSPQGYIKNLRSNTNLFVDIDRWMSEKGYIDYIMPQLYWGFEARTKDKAIAPYAFSSNLSSWIDLKNTGDVTLYLGLGMYRAGHNIADNNAVSEWLRRDDILKRQVEEARKSGQVAGFSFFSYNSFLEANASREAANLISVLK